MLATGPKPITAKKYKDLPEGPPYYQLIEGDLYMAPSPDLFHQGITVNLIVAIGGYLAENPIGRIYSAPSDVALDEFNVFEPDLYFVSNSRKSILTKHGAEGAPDLVIEILSPKTAKFDKGAKREVYARSGVLELWIVDPIRREVQVFHLDESPEAPAATHSGKQKIESRCFPGLKISLQRVFAE